MHDQFNLLKASYALQHCTPNQLYFKDSCFQPLIFWKAMTDVQLVIFLNRQMNAEWHRLFESITLFPCNTGSGLFMQKARGGEIYSLSKETIVLYLNIERPIVPLSSSQCLWHFSGMKPSWCVRFFFCSILFFFFWKVMIKVILSSDGKLMKLWKESVYCHHFISCGWWLFIYTEFLKGLLHFSTVFL